MMAAEVTMRDATAADTAVLTTLVRTSSAYEGLYRVMVADQTIDVDHLRGHVVRVAHGEGGIAGFYSLLLRAGEHATDSELDFMFVADARRGRGIGRLLIDDLRQEAARRSLSRVLIVAHPPAVPFYRAVGAANVGQVPPRGRVTWPRPLMVMNVDEPAHS